jgi:hypothetical protein
MALSKIKGTVIADDAINADRIADGTVVASDLLDNTLTGAKLATDIAISTSGNITTTGAFTSTGINDDATSTAILLNSSQQVILYGGQIQNTNNTSNITYSGGSNSNAGANLTLFGGSHATTPNVTRFRSSATEVMRIASNGNVGIGTTNTSPRLYVVSNSNENGMILDCVGTPSNYHFDVRNDNSSIFRIDSSGNVGIGTTSPQEHLSINVALNDTEGLGLQYLTETKGGIKLSPIGGEIKMGAFNSTGTYFTSLYSNNSEAMRIDSSGNVGIGTTSPDGKFQSGAITSGSGATVGNQAGFFVGAKSKFAGATGLYQNQVSILDTANSANEGSGGALAFAGYQDVDSPTFFATIEGVKDNSTDNNYSGSLRFYTRTNGVANMTEGMRIHPGGIVSAPSGIALGVGTANTSSNVLDDYEEGTFTPTFFGSITAGTYTFANQQGHYRKIGNVVHAAFNLININTSSAGSGGVQIGGLPFTSKSSMAEVSNSLWLSRWDISNDTNFQTVLEDGSTVIRIKRMTSGASGTGIDLDITDKPSNLADIYALVTYFTD